MNREEVLEISKKVNSSILEEIDENNYGKYEVELNNLYILCNEIKKYRNLYRLIIGQEDLLKEINIMSIERRYYKEGKEFCSTRNLIKRVGFTKGTISPYTNVFSLLGLIMKVSNQGLRKNEVFFETVLLTNDVLENAELMARKIDDKHIRISEMNKQKMIEIFGYDLVENIYR